MVSSFFLSLLLKRKVFAEQSFFVTCVHRKKNEKRKKRVFLLEQTKRCILIPLWKPSQPVSFFHFLIFFKLFFWVYFYFWKRKIPHCFMRPQENFDQEQKMINSFVEAIYGNVKCHEASKQQIENKILISAGHFALAIRKFWFSLQLGPYQL